MTLGQGWRLAVEAVPAPAALPIGTDRRRSGAGNRRRGIAAARIAQRHRQLQAAVPQALRDARLAFEDVTVSGTPRRIAVHVAQTGRRSKPPKRRNSGARPPSVPSMPPASPPKPPRDSPAARAWRVADLEVREEGGKSYVYAVEHVVGKPTYPLLPDLLQISWRALRFGKSMRWNDSNVSFSRPLRWLVAALRRAGRAL